MNIGQTQSPRLWRLSIALWVLCLFASTPARADRTAIEGVLTKMQNAVRNADVDGYLALVDSADVCFAKEQVNWATDLKTHRPWFFSLRIADPVAEDSGPVIAPGVFGDDQATFEMTMAWAMESGGTRSVRLPVLFTRDRATNQWRYAGEAWQAADTGAVDSSKMPDKLTPADRAPQAESRRVRVMFFPGFEDVARRVIDVLPEVREHVHAGFERTLDHVQQVKLYPSMEMLQASIYLSYTESLAGWNEPGEAIKLLVSPKASERRLRILLAHEYGHVVTFDMGPRATDMPWWILEGVAELSAETYFAGDSKRVKALVQTWHKAGQLQPWEKLTDFRSVPSELQEHVYKQGQHMLGYISERFGRSKRNGWLVAMAGGASLDNATLEVLGVSFAKLDADWRDMISADWAKPPTSAKSPTPNPPAEGSSLAPLPAVVPTSPGSGD